MAFECCALHSADYFTCIYTLEQHCEVDTVVIPHLLMRKQTRCE